MDSILLLLLLLLRTRVGGSASKQDCRIAVKVSNITVRSTTLMRVLFGALRGGHINSSAFPEGGPDFALQLDIQPMYSGEKVTL